MKNCLAKCNAKINIGLNISGLDEKGYHKLDMIMVPLVYHDSILISEAKNRITNSVTIDDFSVEIKEKNLVTGIIDLLAKEKGFANKFRVIIHKLIPLQGGFGGGSSDAASTMKCVNNILKLNMTNEEMKKLSLSLGSDIPFFIDCKPMRCKNRGEEMTPIEIAKDYYVVITQPKTGCSTKVIYSKYDELGGENCDIDVIEKALKEGNDEVLASALNNSLQRAAVSFVPEIETLISIIKNNGIKIAGMTGSGSGVFGLTTDKKLAKKVAYTLEEMGYFAEYTKILK